jgi:hypothetical protein
MLRLLMVSAETPFLTVNMVVLRLQETLIPKAESCGRMGKEAGCAEVPTKA